MDQIAVSHDAGRDAHAGAPAGWVEKLEAMLEPLDTAPGRPGLSADVRAYVLHGEPVAVLGETTGSDAVEYLLLHRGLPGPGNAEARALYTDAHEVPPAILLRWARLLDASVGQRAAQLWKLALPAGLSWLEALLVHATGSPAQAWSSQRARVDSLEADTVEHLLAEAGHDPALLWRAMFSAPDTLPWGYAERTLLATDLKGWSDALLRHGKTLAALPLAADVERRRLFLSLLEAAAEPALAAFAPQIAELATSTSKQLQAAAGPLVDRCGAAIVPALKAQAKEGRPERRASALQLLHGLASRLGDSALQGFTVDTARADRAASVRALPDAWGEQQQRQADTALVDAVAYTMPTVDWSAPQSTDLPRLLADIWAEAGVLLERENRQLQQHHERLQGQGNQLYKLQQHEPFDAAGLARLQVYVMEGGQALPPTATARGAKPVTERRAAWLFFRPPLLERVTHAAMTPVALARCLAFFDILTEHDGSLCSIAVDAFNRMHQGQERPSLLELSVMLRQLAGIGAGKVFDAYCSQPHAALATDWDAGQLWPFFIHHTETLAARLGPRFNRDYWADPGAEYRAVATLPVPPPAVVDAMFERALGTARTERPLAQQALTSLDLPGTQARIAAALADGKAEVRAAAAHWLMRLGQASTVPALEQAVAKERHDVTRGAMLDALEALGQPLEKYFDRAAMLAEALKVLAKPLPKDLAWFAWETLPVVRWHDSGEPVPAALVRWLLVQAVRQKSPEPNVLLRRLCGMFTAGTREGLGQFVLERWLEQDARPIEPGEAHARALQQAAETHADMRQYPQYFQDHPDLGKSEEELAAKYLPGWLRHPVGSAIGSKGLLAVAAACAGADAVAPVARYIKEHYGSRAAQGKALIAMLAWIDHPSATQLMLAIGNRFRTRSFQEEATRQAEALAERKGWTLAELADRTMPTAGFDDDGLLELSYGRRTFIARLQPDLQITLSNPEGKAIASLPEPRKDDDPDAAKLAKKTLAAARKETREIVRLQASRLYDALCTERDWAFGEWDVHLNRHPVVRHLVQRLVWTATTADGRVLDFRPLDDASLSDSSDNAVDLPADARVRIAHDTNMDAGRLATWISHLADYEVPPLFQQFGKGVYVLPAADAGATAIKDFEGHLIEAFVLRGRALKLDYTRAETVDGGWFIGYEKRFQTLGLVAEIEFTGNPLPETNRTVALLALSFSRAGERSWERKPLPLSTVPPVLLSECYHDLRLIAAEGSGYDPQWKAKSEY